MLEFPEHYNCVYHTHPSSSPRSRTRVDTTFRTPHEKVSFIDHPNVQEKDFGMNSNMHMVLVQDVSSLTTSTRVASSLSKGTSPISLIKGHVVLFCYVDFNLVFMY
jgi:hypothetical protein